MVSLEDLNEEKYASLSLGGVAPIENKKISLNSSSDNHEYFKIHLHESDSSSTYLDETYYVSS